MGAMKQMLMEYQDKEPTAVLVERLIERFSTINGVNEVPTEKLVHLMNVVECEQVSRLARQYYNVYDEMGI